MTLRQGLIVLTSAVVASQIGTQVLAFQAHYTAVLGTPRATVQVFAHSHALYWPWQGCAWVWRWGAHAPDAVRLAGLAAVGPLLLGCWWAAQTGRQGQRHAPPRMTGHGTTQWATGRDIRQAGLRAPTGIVLGAARRRALRFDGPENVLLVGPQRQGKGVGVIIPTLLEIDGHTVTIDVRGETWAATAGYRATRGRVLRLAITQQGSARFNLLEEIRVGTPQEFMDASIVADMLVDPGGNKPDRDHWEKTSKALITCAVLYEVHRRARPTLSNIASFWSQPRKTIVEIVQHILATAPTAQVAELGQEVLNKGQHEAPGVVSSMMTQLFLFRDPTVAANTGTSDFRLADFTRHDTWTSLYVVLSSGEEEHVRPFMRVFLRLALQRWLELSERRHRITLLMDEFTSWGRIPFFVTNLAVLGGRGIRTLVAVQNIPQLRETYGQADVITEQCKVRVYFAANGQSTGSEISRQTGTGTATTMQESWRRGAFWAGAGRTRQAQQHARPLLTESEAMQLPAETAVIQVAGSPPIWGQKVRYWEYRTWRRRSQLPPPAGRRNVGGRP